jgi:hypothetical protein
MIVITKLETVIVCVASLVFAAWAVIFCLWVEYGWLPWKKEKPTPKKDHQSSPPVDNNGMSRIFEHDEFEIYNPLDNPK